MSFASPKSIIFTCKLDSALKISVQVCLLMIRLTGWRKQCCLVWCRGGWCRCRAWTQSQRQPVLDCWLWEFPKTKCFYLLLTSYCYDFLPVEQTFCTYLQSAGTLCYWFSQTALLPKDAKSVWTFCFTFFLLSFFSCSYLKVLGQDDALQAWLKVLLQVQDGSALFHLHLGRCQLVFFEDHLGKDLKLVSSVSQVLGPCVLLVLCCKQLLVRFPLANNVNFYESQRSYFF